MGSNKPLIIGYEGEKRNVDIARLEGEILSNGDRQECLKVNQPLRLILHFNGSLVDRRVTARPIHALPLAIVLHIGAPLFAASELLCSTVP